MIHAYRRTLGRVCRQITVSEDCVVPARHEANILVEMVDKGVLHPVDDWVIETKQLSSRVMAARTLIDVKQERLVARICNYSDEPYALEAGSYLARAKPVDCLPGPGEEITNGIGDYNCRVSPVSVVTGATAAADQSLTAERDPAIAFSEATGNAKVTAAGAAQTVTKSAESSIADDPYEHVLWISPGVISNLSGIRPSYPT